MLKQERKKIVVAMSGGVDSSVAAKILVEQGHDVLGIFLNFWKDPDAKNIENKCCSTKALLDARMVCDQIGIRLYTFDFVNTFKTKIVDNFISEYKAGRTPNPCVRCNKYVKLGLLLKKVEELGYNYLATGHYSIIKNTKDKKGVELFKGEDQKKDQSYFLYKLSQKQLQKIILPLGEYTKVEVREMAEKWGLLVAKKSESQEICFVPKDHNDFLKKYLQLKRGLIKTLDDQVVGEHNGLSLYTIGQRKGVEIGGIGPFYVVRKDLKTNILYVTGDTMDDQLFMDQFGIKEVNWVNEVSFPLACDAVIRYGSKLVVCTVDMNNLKKECFVNLKEKVRAITSGQSIVFYDKNKLLGGGVIM
ncbi:MAG: tRNA 2-thiouridine(34) synthase MnmA [Candidatus Falkowbacteria bacterium]|nr:tRNA 2-thiouridine(34) synthase MnmA [Candidatus Falkowbacteria bacterium]